VFASSSASQFWLNEELNLTVMESRSCPRSGVPRRILADKPCVAIQSDGSVNNQVCRENDGKHNNHPTSNKF
jgi:hypothetical protein